MASPRRIDVHFHLIPPFYSEAVYAAGRGPAIGKYPDWTPQLALDLMDACGIEVALTSLAQLFQKPLCRTTFETAVYPAMDATLAGRTIPRVYGPVTQAQAFRIASGRWKVADHAVTSITNPLTVNGTTVTGT